jgi:ABC-type nickel/cobalt efflux system permease component RcnA
METNIISKELALILMSSVVIIPLVVGLWYIWKQAMKDFKEFGKHSHQHD